MKELDTNQIESVSGGNPVLAALTVYTVVSIGWDFYQGYEDGYNATMQR